MLIQMMTKGKPSQIANLKTKLEKLEKATDDDHWKLAHRLGNEVNEDMMSLSDSVLCEECHSQFTEKIEHICGYFDEELDSSGLSEELWAAMDECLWLFDEEDNDGTPACGHAK